MRKKVIDGPVEFDSETTCLVGFDVATGELQMTMPANIAVVEAMTNNITTRVPLLLVLSFVYHMGKLANNTSKEDAKDWATSLLLPLANDDEASKYIIDILITCGATSAIKGHCSNTEGFDKVMKLIEDIGFLKIPTTET